MRLCLLILFLLLLCSKKEEFPPPQKETPKPSLQVKKGLVCRRIRRGEPDRCAAVFPAHVRKLYCFTRIEGAVNPTFVTHLWLYKNTALFSIDLPVKSQSWGTYSRKNIPSDHTGEWTIQILDSNHEVIKEIKFYVGTI